MLSLGSDESRQLERDQQAYEVRVAEVLARLARERAELSLQQKQIEAQRRRLVEVGRKLRRRWLRQKRRMHKTVVAANVRSLRWQERLQARAQEQEARDRRLAAQTQTCRDERAGLTLLMKELVAAQARLAKEKTQWHRQLSELESQRDALLVEIGDLETRRIQLGREHRTAGDYPSRGAA
jgi:chromosome segregation ATPase